MLRRCLSIAMGSTAVLILVLPLYADDYELQYKALDLRQEGIYTRTQYLRPGTRPEERLSAEPKYRSRMPIYAVATLGNDGDNRYTVVVDESGGTGRGYDILYVDRNNNENLTDDPRIVGRIRRQGTSSTTGNFGPVGVMVEYDDRTVPYYFSVSYQRYGGQSIRRGARFVENMNLSLQPSGYYAGVVSFGGSKHRIAVIDFNSNGLFNEYFKPRSGVAGSGGSFYAIGDQILIDANSDGRFERGYPNNKELYPYAKYVQVDGKWCSLDIAPRGGKVEVRNPSMKLGTIRIPAQLGSCSLQLVSVNGILKFEETGNEFQVPTATYQFYGHTMEVKHSSGNWRYDTRGTASGKKFEVAEDTVLPLRFGPPLLLNLSYSTRGPGGTQPKAGDTIQLSLTFSGQGGEQYTNIMKNGTRPPAPTYKIVDEAGKIVDKGTFEYG